ncbi:peptidylprolyl isomerase [Ectobacillus sp. JY-23]|uniref:peptidylprolyl isomerase n=1 Tax=Ectobacillus sp. JY-23 TaxID=2933872 RepID=UPI001FF4EBC3|nr:peptidylprolyl isomerase [Ectobacillus sp. JY-23]UOY93124.1 peptidylprolyl isomerase [Ectobacillus sp. JY-23]
MQFRNIYMTGLVLIGCITLFLLYVQLFYSPLLYITGDTVVRRADWERVSHMYGNMMTRQEEFLKQRSLEDVVLHYAKQQQIIVNDEAVKAQMNQLGSNKTERIKQLKSLGMTEEESYQNIYRAMTGFQVKQQLTKHITVSEQEIQSVYQQNIEAFSVPELRTIKYIHIKNLQNKHELDRYFLSIESFKDAYEIVQHPSIQKGLQELVSIAQLQGELSKPIATYMFQAPENQLIGPIQDIEGQIWFYVEAVQKPQILPLPTVKAKIHSTILLEKQTAFFQKWLKTQKKVQHYKIFPGNLKRHQLISFWFDLPHHVMLLL